MPWVSQREVRLMRALLPPPGRASPVWGTGDGDLASALEQQHGGLRAKMGLVRAGKGWRVSG